MATQRPILDEASLRETKDDLMERVTDQQRQFGMLADPAAAEAFLAPILRQVEVDHDEARERDALRKDAKARQHEALADSRERRQARELPEGYRLMEQHVADLDWDLATNELRGKLPEAPGMKPLSPLARAAVYQMPAMRRTLAHLKTLGKVFPEWRMRIIATVTDPRTSMAQKDAELKRLIKESLDKVGDLSVAPL